MTENATVTLQRDSHNGRYYVSVTYDGTGIFVGDYTTLTRAADFAERHVRLVRDVLGIPCDLVLGNE